MKGAFYHGFSVLRGVAAFGIVGTHLNLEPHTAGAEFFLGFTDMGVGIFAAISGFLMVRSLDAPDFSLRVYLGKRVKRLLPTYLVWSGVYIVATCVFDLLLDGGGINPRFFHWQTWCGIVFWGAAGVQLWFLIELFYAQILVAGVYRLFPQALKGFSGLRFLTDNREACVGSGYILLAVLPQPANRASVRMAAITRVTVF